jgi:phage pi2 protein 07
MGKWNVVSDIGMDGIKDLIEVSVCTHPKHQPSHHLFISLIWKFSDSGIEPRSNPWTSSFNLNPLMKIISFWKSFSAYLGVSNFHMSFAKVEYFREISNSVCLWRMTQRLRNFPSAMYPLWKSVHESPTPVRSLRTAPFILFPDTQFSHWKFAYFREFVVWHFIFPRLKFEKMKRSMNNGMISLSDCETDEIEDADMRCDSRMEGRVTRSGCFVMFILWDWIDWSYYW